MNFSRYQWLICVILDVFIKGGLLYYVVGAVALGAAPISVFVPLTFALSMFRFISLFAARGLVALIELARGAKFALTLVVAEILFIGSILFWGLYGIHQDVGKCPTQQSCPWPDFTAEWMWIAVVLLAIDLLPILIAVAFGCLANGVKRLLQRNRVNTAVPG